MRFTLAPLSNKTKHSEDPTLMVCMSKQASFQEGKLEGGSEASTMPVRVSIQGTLL